MAPARAEGPPLITAAPVMGIMLGLLRGCDAAEERMSTLQALKRLIGQHDEHVCCLLTWHAHLSSQISWQ